MVNNDQEACTIWTKNMHQRVIFQQENTKEPFEVSNPEETMASKADQILRLTWVMYLTT
jgi:hypothetical protein